MITTWTQGMSKPERQEFINEYKGAKVVRERLVEMLVSRIKEMHKDQMKMEDFDCPNWQYKQAAYLSKEKTLLGVIDLLK